MTGPAAALTQTELLALAMDAERRGDNGRSLAYLKEAAARADATAKICFLLGSEFAQLRLLDDAIIHMRRAIEIEPGFSIARFQLGMLFFTSGAVQEAVTVWEPLNFLPESDSLRHFHEAMLQLMADQPSGALSSIDRGVHLNTINQPLNGDMLMLAGEIRRLEDGSGNATPEAGPAADLEETGSNEHLFLSAYHRGRPH